MTKLAFPTNWGESAELQFKDGPRVVPEYLVAMMSGIETERYTYDQAVAMANKNAEMGKFGVSRQKMIDEHFRGLRNGRD